MDLFLSTFDALFIFRIEKLTKFVKAMHRPTRANLAPVRVKDIHKMEALDNVFSRSEINMSEWKK